MMKILILWSLIFFSSFIYADQEAYQKVTGYHYSKVRSDLVKFQLDIRYDIEEDKVYIYISEFVTTVAYELRKYDRIKMITTIDKYIEWREKAIDMEVELEKNIDDIYLKGYFKSSDDWYRSCGATCMARASFFSQNTTRHQFVLNFDKIIDCSNDYIDHKPEQVYWDYDDIVILRESLTEEKLQAVVKEVEKKKVIEDAFK